MQNFSKWLNQKYIAWQNVQGTEQTFMSYAAYLSIDPNNIIDIMLERALPDAGDLMAIAAKEGMEAYDVIGEERPDARVIEVYSTLGPMPTDFRMRMAHAIFDAEAEIKSRNISAESEEAKQVYIDTFERWGFQYRGKPSRQT